MRYIRKYIIGSLALPLLLLSCTDNGLTVANPNGGSANGGMVRTELSISTPAALSASLTRAVSVANESTLNGHFAVFGFDSNADTLMFVLKTGEGSGRTDYVTGDRNTESNLNSENDYADSYGDYTESPSIAWHPADETNSSGRLYIEYWETPDPVHLLVLSNVDSTAIAALLTATADETDPTQTSEPAITTGMSFAEVTAALAPALDYVVKDANATYQVSVVGMAESLPDDDDPTPDYIPMTGECTLDNGIMLGSTGDISLRRSVAKMSFSFSWTTEFYGKDENGQVNLDTIGDNIPLKVFIPDSIRIVNIYRYATVYAGPSTELEPNTTNTEPNYSTLNYSENSETQGQIDTLKYDALIRLTKDDFTFDAEGNMHVSVDLLLAETKNTRIDAYKQQGTGGGDFTPNDYPRVSILIAGRYYDTDATASGGREGWYRLDLIPDDGEYQELGEILRNHHYKFEIVDPTKRPSSSAQEAYELSVPDNYRGEGIYSLVVIDDEDYVSITADSNYGDESGVPYYIAVSATYVDLERSENACALVKMETNYPNWSIDESEIPWVDNTGEGQMVYAFDIVYDEGAKTIYVWLDFPGEVEVDKTYAYYIVAGNIRKKMRIHIVEGDYKEEP